MKLHERIITQKRINLDAINVFTYCHFHECAFVGYGVIRAKNCAFSKCGKIRYDSEKSSFDNCVLQNNKENI